MSTLDELKIAIEELRDADYTELRQWFSEKDWQQWDTQIAADSEAGRLDFLIKEALNEKTKGQLKDL